MSKYFYIFGLVVTLFLQGCASGPNILCAGTQGCGPTGNAAADQFWPAFGSEYDGIRKHGQRLAADGKTILTPVPGMKGVYQNQVGYRDVHQLSCQKESLASTLVWGVLVPFGSAAIQNPLGQNLAFRGGQVVQQQAGTARYYKCQELAEALARGNMRFYEQVKQQQIPVREPETVVASVQANVAPQVIPQRRKTPEEFCAETWAACPAGGEWGIMPNGTQCGCR